VAGAAGLQSLDLTQGGEDGLPEAQLPEPGAGQALGHLCRGEECRLPVEHVRCAGCCVGAPEGAVAVHEADHQVAAGQQHAPRLAQGRGDVVQKADDGHHEDHVEAGVRVGQRLGDAVHCRHAPPAGQPAHGGRGLHAQPDAQGRGEAPRADPDLQGPARGQQAAHRLHLRGVGEAVAVEPGLVAGRVRLKRCRPGHGSDHPSGCSGLQPLRIGNSSQARRAARAHAHSVRPGGAVATACGRGRQEPARGCGTRPPGG